MKLLALLAPFLFYFSFTKCVTVSPADTPGESATIPALKIDLHLTSGEVSAFRNSFYDLLEKYGLPSVLDAFNFLSDSIREKFLSTVVTPHLNATPGSEHYAKFKAWSVFVAARAGETLIANTLPNDHSIYKNLMTLAATGRENFKDEDFLTCSPSTPVIQHIQDNLPTFIWILNGRVGEPTPQSPQPKQLPTSTSGVPEPVTSTPSAPAPASASAPSTPNPQPEKTSSARLNRARKNNGVEGTRVNAICSTMIMLLMAIIGTA